MFTIKRLPVFSAWLESLDDATVRGVIVARIKRLELGLMGGVEPVGEGVSQLRIALGAGVLCAKGVQTLLCCSLAARNARKSGISNEPRCWLRCWINRSMCRA